MIKRIYLLFLALIITPGLISCSNEARINYSTYSSIQTTDLNENDSLISCWNDYFEKGNYDKLLHDSREKLYEALGENDTVAILTSGAYLAQTFYFCENSDSVIYYLNILSHYEKASADPKILVMLLSVKGFYAQHTLQDYPLAMNCFRECFNILANTNDIDNTIRLLLNIVDIHYMRREIIGLKYAEQAYELSQHPQISNPNTIAHVHFAMGEMLSLAGRNRDAVTHLQKAEAIAEAHNYKALENPIHLVKADILRNSGANDSAASEYLKSLQFADYAEPTFLAMTYLNYGKLCENVDSLDKALSIYRKGLSVANENNIYDFKPELLRHISSVAMKNGDTTLSDYYFNIYERVLDTISRNNHIYEFNAIATSHEETEHKYEILYKEAELRHAQQKLIISAIFGILVLIVLILIWLMYRKQHKANQILIRQYNNMLKRMDDREKRANLKDTDRQQLYHRIEKMIKEQRLFLKSDLTVDDIASAIGTNRTYVSSTINTIAGMNFYSYLDTFRIREATEKIKTEGKRIVFKQLATDVGYNSVPVFYKAFQKETGCTPGQYRNEILRQARSSTT